MLGFVKDNLVSLLTELPLEKGKQKVAERIDQGQLRRRVDEQMKKYKDDIFECMGNGEAFDLENANQYIKEHLFDSVSACFNLDLKWQQEQARRSLMDSVQTAAGVKEGNSTRKSAVNQYVKIFLDIIEAYYLEKVDERDRFLAGKTIEEVERLLKEYISSSHGRIMEAIAYQGSFAEYIDGIQQASDNQKILHYRNKLLKFQGREQELQILRTFLRDEAAISWMAVTGDGGSGKSKLLYQFTDEMEADTEWKTVWLHRDNCQSVLRFNGWAYPCNLLFVVDYAGAVSDQIGRWIEMLDRNRRRPVKIRFVLLEREGIGREHGAEIEPMWYQKLKGFGEQERAVQRREAICFEGAPFLKLEHMDAVSLDKMIRDYASRNGRELDREIRKWILGKAAEIDKKRGGIRPLIVLFTADAVMRDREYNKWDIPALIENILRRYEGNKASRQGGHWRETVCQGREDLFCALEEMLMFATAVGGWKLEDSDELPEVFRASAEKILEMTADELKTFICAVNEDDDYNGVLQPLEPDLIGEFYVLEYWNQRRFQKEYFEKIKAVFWSKSYMHPFVIFWSRCIQNYCTENRFRVFFENGMERLKPQDDTGKKEAFFDLFRVDLIACQKSEEAEKTLELLRKYQEKRTRDKWTEFIYARGLYNLAYKQEEGKAEKTLELLRKLSDRGKDEEEIEKLYAEGLFNLSNKQGEEKAEKTLESLRQLSERCESNEEIALTYAQGLYNLSNRQGEEKAEKTLESLRQLSEKREENEEISFLYAVGLYNLSNKLEARKAKTILALLRELCEKKMRTKKFEILFTKGLVNLIIKQEEEDAEKTVEHLGKLSKKKEKGGEIDLRYAEGLFILSGKQGEEKAEKTLILLGKLSEKSGGNENIELLYTQGLLNLLKKQGAEKAEKTLGLIKKMSERRKGNEQIEILYASGIFNLLNKQGGEKAEKTLVKLGELSEKREKNEEIAITYAKGLVNLINKQEEEKAEKTLGLLRKLSEKREENKEIEILYASGLYNLSNKQEEEKAEKTLRLLRELSKKETENEEIEIIYARGLYNLSNKQGEEKAEKTLGVLRELSEKPEVNEEIEILYASGLHNLSYKQEEAEAEKTLELLRELSEKRAENERIVILYVSGLFILLGKQKGEKAENTLELLKDLSKNREENENIQLSYAIVLANLIRTQEIEKAERMLGELKNLTQRIENVEIILAYVKSIVVLCKKRDISIKKRNKMFREFCSTCEQYSKYDEIIMFYRTIMSYLTFPSKN